MSGLYRILALVRFVAGRRTVCNILDYDNSEFINNLWIESHD